MVYLVDNKKTGQLRRDFRIQLLDRHFAQTHNLAKSVAVTKLEGEQKILQQALVSAMADQPAGNYSMFERNSFTQFLKRYGEYCKNYRQIPDFLNFHRRSLARQVSAYSRKLMDHFNMAINQALSKQTEQLRSGQTPNTRITVTCFMDHVVFKDMRKKVGCVTALIRIREKDSEFFMSMPIDIWDVKEDVTITDLNGVKVSSSGGTTAKANANRFYRAIESLFEENNRQFLAGTYDGAIYDKKKTVFINTLKNKYELQLIDILSFTCQTHGHALKTNLSTKRCYKDLGLKYEGEDKEPDPERTNPDVIWFGNEKETYGSSFRTFNQISKLLASKAKKNKMSFAEYVYLLAFQDAKANKGHDINPQRTNNPYVRWKNHFFSLNEDERQVPAKMIQENDKKLRRFFQKCYKIVDNIAYCKIAMNKKEFKGFFPNGAEIDPDYIHMVGHWAALVQYLWSINDSNRHGYDCSLMRSLMIVLKAATENHPHHSPLSNILIR